MVLLKLFYVFFKIGLFAFGGGYTIVALAYDELVKKRKWLERGEFFDFYALSQTLPGIISVNFAAFIGNKIAKFMGGIFAVLGMIFPAVLVILLVANFIVDIERYETISHVLNGVRIAVAVMILSLVIRQGKENIRTKTTFVIALFTFVWLLIGLSPIIPLIFSGIFGWLYYLKKRDVLK